MRRYFILFFCFLCGAIHFDSYAQKHLDTLYIYPKVPAHAQIMCSFDYASSEIVITPCTYTGMVLVTVTNIDTGALSLFTMASLSCGEERIPFYGYPGYYLAEIEILSGSGRKYSCLFLL
jgi:hypothetical protein